ncbi:Serine/threonine-protein kinase, partial [Coemansia sp. RSA 1933]
SKSGSQPSGGGSGFFGGGRQQPQPQPQQQQQQQQHQQQQYPGTFRGANPTMQASNMAYGGGSAIPQNAAYQQQQQQQQQQHGGARANNAPAGDVHSSGSTPSAASQNEHSDASSQGSALTTNGLPSASQAQGSSVKRSGILVIRVMEARNLVYPPGSQQLMARYAPYKNEAHHRPYAVVEFDKNEAVVASLGGDMQNPIWKYRVSFDVSRTGPVMVSLYQRTAELQYQRPAQPRGFQRFGNSSGPNSSSSNSSGAQSRGAQVHPLGGQQGAATGAIFLGAVQILPDFADGRLYDDWVPLLGGAGGSGHVRVQYCFNKKDATPLSIE